MKGLELSRRYYELFGKQAIINEFPELFSRMAIGLAGEGSECFGFDDSISVDHDFEPAFCIWLVREDYEKFGFQLEKMYHKLPKEFEGFSRQRSTPVGGSRHGVMCIDDYYNKFLGAPTEPKNAEHWLHIPPQSLAAAVNGEVFYDGLGEFSKIRKALLCGYPQDVRLKKIAAHLIMMQQTGLYNYNRCIQRGENGAAQLCVFEFVKHTISLIYLLNNKYEPFYKWVYRGMRDFEILGYLAQTLTTLTEIGNGEQEAQAKVQSIEEICRLIVDELKKQEFSDVQDYDITAHAFSVQNKIKDFNLRNMHIMEGI